MTIAEKDYTLIDHTADIGVEVRGKDFADLLVHAGEALFSVITDLSSVEANTPTVIRVDPGEYETVMREWLENLLSHFNRKDMLFSSFEVKVSGDEGVTAQVWGEVLDPRRHTLHTEIKGITYHQFQVRPTRSGWMARIIFDV